jgi:hypothetical protein
MNPVNFLKKSDPFELRQSDWRDLRSHVMCTDVIQGLACARPPTWRHIGVSHAKQTGAIESCPLRWRD